MKKVLILCMFLVVVFSSCVFAQEAVKDFLISKDEVKNDTTFAAGSSVSNSGTINNDFFAAGQTINNDGMVNGDIFAVGSNLNFNGIINGNIRAAGSILGINGTVDRNVTVVGNNIAVDKAAVVKGTMMAAGSTVKVSGTIGKTLYLAGASVIIDGNVAGDTYIEADSITISPGAKIGGALTYTSKSDANIAEGTVLGKISKITPSVAENKTTKKAKSFFGDVLSKITWLIGTFLLGALLIKLFNKFFDSVPDTIRTSWGMYLGTGLLSLICTPIAAIILLITVIGAPIGISAMILYALLIYISSIPVSIFIGNLLLKGNKSIYLRLLLGLVLLAIVYLIPIVGALVKFIVLLLGLGLLVFNIFFSKEELDPKLDIS